ncbi:MAG: hypothetical protein K0S42_124 [Microvirga sp.]|jgi:hypothetical protein|nr:hypothetical protein [Microvirga sp.]
MALPVGRGTYRDPVLSRYATRNFDIGADGFIAGQISVTVPVDKQSGIYNVFDPAGWLSTVDDLRAPKARPKDVWFTVSSDTYFAHNRALKSEIALEDLSNEDPSMQLRQNHTDLILTVLRRNQEQRLATLATSSGGPATIVALSGATSWASGSADIVGQVTSAHAGVWLTSGMSPNTAIIDWQSLNAIKTHPRLLSNWNATAGGELSDEIVARNILKVQRLVVAKVLQNTAKQGQAMSVAPIWGNICLFAVTNPENQAAPNFLSRFRWRPSEGPYGMPVGDNFNVVRDRFDRAGEPKVEVIEGGYFQGEKLTGRELGYLLKNTLAA